MSRFPGNIIKLPNVTPTQNSASGVWSLKDQLVYQRNNLWPFQRDPYFNYTTLLLQGNVPNTTGPQAMTLPLSYNADASTNNFLVTPNGDVGPKPFSPYFGGNYSVYFDGSGDYLNVATNAAFNFGTGDATVEFWFNAAGAQPGNYPGIVSSSDYNTSGSASIRYSNTGYSKKIFMYLNGGGDPVIASASTVEYGVWAHVAIVRQGTSLKLYLNGFLDASVTISASLGWNLGYGELRVGRGFDVDGVGGYFNGYLSNIRLVKGTAVYTTNFTPSTQPLQNIPNTSLLTCQSNRFIDNSTANSGSGFTITRNGDSRITDNSPFVSTDFTTGAGYFDGVTDYLNGATNTATAFNLTGDFTIEMWVYCTDISASPSGGQGFISWSDSSGWNGWQVFHVSGSLKFEFLTASTGAGSITSSTITNSQWVHIAVVRNGTSTNNINFYVNGVANGSASYNSSQTSASSFIKIGTDRTGTNYLRGYISGLRVVNGAAVYTGNFSPPSLANLGRSGATSIAAYPSTTNVNTSFAESATSLLTLQTRAPSQNIGFIDSSPNEFIVTKNGNTTQGTFSPFSPTGWGNYFNGTDAYLTGPSGAALQLSTGDFTIEAWVFGPTQAAYAGICGGATTPSGWTFRLNNSGNLLLTNGSTVRTSTATVPTNSWNHVCVSRQGTDLRFFVNGSLSNTIPSNSDSIDLTGGGFQVGKGFSVDGVSGLFSGYISNLRIVKGVAVYTGAFTPPASPLTATQSAGPTGSNIQAITGTQTSLLTCQSNRFRDNSSNNFTITTNGTPSVQAFSPFAPANAVSPLVTGGSGYFDGGASSSNDYLTVPDSPVFTLGTSDFTIEAWVYALSSGTTDRYIISHADNATAAGSSFALYIFNGNSKFYFEYYISSSTSTVTSDSAIVLNQWNHVAICRSGGTLAMFVNGTRQASPASISTSSINNCANSLSVGARTTGGSTYTGYLSCSRMVVGTDIYGASNTNIVVPTTPPTAIPNTSLLLNFTNGAAVDATGKNNLESVGKAQNSGVQAKWDPLRGGSSMYFDGSGYLAYRSNSVNVFGTGDYTVEFWVYHTSIAGQQTYFSDGFGASAGPYIYKDSSNFIGLYYSSQILTASSTIAVNNWYHVAVVRQSGTVKLYIDGVQKASNPDTTNLTSPIQYIGNDGSSGAFSGYMTARITNVARYSGSSTSTPNFTLPTGPFPIG